MSTLPNQLVLLRHAHALSALMGEDDVDRRLSPRGEREAIEAGNWMKQNLDPPDLLLCSSAQRTRDTLRGLIDAGAELPAPQFEPRIYEATPGTLIAVLEGIGIIYPDAERIWMIGHNPGLEQLVINLSGTPLPRGMVTAGIAVLQKDAGSPDHRLVSYRAS